MLRNSMTIALCFVAALIFLSGCTVSTRGPFGQIGVSAPAPHAGSGPPPHAPAHGYRARHHYYYYPDVRVYYDTGRDVYFYLRDGEWTMSVDLPNRLRVSLGSRVSLEMEADRPYVRHREHRMKYPGKKGKGRGRGRGGKKHDDDDFFD